MAREEKQYLRVLDAVKLGAETSSEVEAVTGLPLSHCSLYLGQLADDGLIRRVKKNARRYNKAGRASHLYFPLEGRTPPIDAGPMSSSFRTIDTYTTPTVAGLENRTAGFIRPETLISMGRVRSKNRDGQ